MAVADLGPTQLKNIERPIRVYSLQVGVPAHAKAATPAGPVAPKKSSSLAPLAAGIAALLIALAGGAWWLLEANRPAAVATKWPAAVASSVATPAEARHLSLVVLPFANLSNNPAQDYFADGITENLTTDLSRLSGAFVIARNTAFTFKGKNVDAREIGRELASATCWKALSSATRAACGSMSNSSTRRPAITFGPTASTNLWLISSKCRTRSLLGSPINWGPS